MTLRKLQALSAMVIAVFACLRIAHRIVLSLADALFPVGIPVAFKASHEQPKP